MKIGSWLAVAAGGAATDPERLVEQLGPVVVVGHDEDRLLARVTCQCDRLAHERAGEPAPARLGSGVHVLHLRGETVRAQLGDRHEAAVTAPDTEQAVGERPYLAAPKRHELPGLAGRRLVLLIPAAHQPEPLVF